MLLPNFASIDRKSFRNSLTVRPSTAQQLTFRKKFVGQIEFVKTKNNNLNENRFQISFILNQFCSGACDLRAISNYPEFQNNMTIHHHGKPFCSKEGKIDESEFDTIQCWVSESSED